jgi:hypothetical protein
VGYTDELARTLRILKQKLGGRVEVVALPPVPLGGINSFATLRAVVEGGALGGEVGGRGRSVVAEDKE